MKTSELTGAALDWAVAKCEGAESLRENPHRFDRRLVCRLAGRNAFLQDLRFSTDWTQGGPIIEREVICLLPHANGGWVATVHGVAMPHKTGETPLIAAMRCYVASKLGDEVDIPEELQ